MILLSPTGETWSYIIYFLFIFFFFYVRERARAGPIRRGSSGCSVCCREGKGEEGDINTNICISLLQRIADVAGGRRSHGFVFSTFSRWHRLQRITQYNGLALLSGVRMSDSAVRESGRLFSARVCDTRRMRAARNRRDGDSFLMINGRRSSFPVDIAASRCRCFAHSGNFGLADSGGQERETITPRIGLETESAASRRAMPACDWTAGRVFYQEPLSARRASREMTREKTNAESVREKIPSDSLERFSPKMKEIFEFFTRCLFS